MTTPLAEYGGGRRRFPAFPSQKEVRRNMLCTVGIALLGCGTVGDSVAERLLDERDAIERRSGLSYELRGVAVRDLSKRRRIDRRLLTNDALGLVEDPRVDVIVECIGGTSAAVELVERALERGRSVVTANKDLLATQGPRLRALASSRHAGLRYEAAVCGAVPIVRMLEESLAGDRVEAICGVMNGTCNAILTAMESGAEYDEALCDARARGYAEADPSNDVDGIDAAHKLALLMQLAFGLAVLSPRLPVSGIAGITKREIARARMLGYRIRLVAAARRDAAGVAPLLVPEGHPFAAVSGPENIVRVLARDAGPLVVRGLGAGGVPTASAILGDVVTSLRAIAQRHDLALAQPLDAAHDIAPLFAELVRHPELPRYPLWDDSILDAPVSHARRAHS
jgi:homoserine dehydrogenase